MKRKLQDYFPSMEDPPAKTSCKEAKHTLLSASPLTSNVSGAPATTSSAFANTIPGLEVLPNYITTDEEARLLSFLDAQPWRTDLARRVIHYGGTYCLMPPRDATSSERRAIESNIITAPPIPQELDFVLSRMVQTDRLYGPTQRPEFCIVNSYTGTNGISAHVENFRFGSPVTGLTLLNGDWMRFHELTAPDDGSVRSGKASKAVKTGKRVDIWLPRRSLLVMKNEAREKWQHEIVRGRKGRNGNTWRRVSLTFRTLKSSANAKPRNQDL